MSDIASHGRGGAGNVGKDPEGTKYVDGGITAEGPGSGPAGRGGAGNFEPPPEGAEKSKATIKVPQEAMRPSMENADYHTGRGGAGNEHLANKKAEGKSVGLADKLKTKIMAVFKK